MLPLTGGASVNEIHASREMPACPMQVVPLAEYLAGLLMHWSLKLGRHVIGFRVIIRSPVAEVVGIQVRKLR